MGNIANVYYLSSGIIGNNINKKNSGAYPPAN
jgi:hypothetical protein